MGIRLVVWSISSCTAQRILYIIPVLLTGSRDTVKFGSVTLTRGHWDGGRRARRAICDAAVVHMKRPFLLSSILVWNNTTESQITVLQSFILLYWEMSSMWLKLLNHCVWILSPNELIISICDVIHLDGAAFKAVQGNESIFLLYTNLFLCSTVFGSANQKSAPNLCYALICFHSI